MRGGGGGGGKGGKGGERIIKNNWLDALGFNATLTASHVMAVGDPYVFPGFFTPVITQHFFPKPPTTFLTCFCGGEKRKYAGKKVRLNWGSNSQPPAHESDTLTTEPPRWGVSKNKANSKSKKLITPFQHEK